MSHTCLYFPAAEHLCALSGTHFHLLDLVGSRLISSPSLVADKMLSWHGTQCVRARVIVSYQPLTASSFQTLVDRGSIPHKSYQWRTQDFIFWAYKLNQIIFGRINW